jgi:preprotein translocase subunit SecA
MDSLKAPFAFTMLNVDGFNDMVNSYGAPLRKISDRKLTDEAGKVRMRLHKEGLTSQPIAHSFALVREASVRTTGMKHYGSQLTGGLVLLRGMIAEMETGEGKTLTATLPASTAALAGIPVHIVTVNDYLTARDAELMGPLYKLLGLSVGCITHDLTPDERRVAYDSDITYCTNKELAFDYLRDILTLSDMTEPLRLQGESLYARSARSSRLMLRGLHYAIVDEADSILIDEAKTPLIISATSDSKEKEQFLEEALQMANSLNEGEDFKVDSNNRKILLTNKGEEIIQDMASELGPLWSSPVRQKEIVTLALSASHFFIFDEHYIVRDNKVQIVDEYTGRVMEDRSWERGLHQLIELKEGCEISGMRETLAKMSYQKFFRRYLHIAGMTGTAKEVRKELLSVYGLNTVFVPTNRPVIRKRLPDSIFPKASDKWAFVVERIGELHSSGRPVLVGTRSVAASELVSRLLFDAGCRV